MNGKHGDHPLTDIFAHGMTVFGKDIDDIIRKLSRLMPGPELESLVNWLQPPPTNTLKQLLEETLRQKQREARQRGWEIEQDK